MLKKQKKLSKGSFFLLLIFVSMFFLLATNLYITHFFEPLSSSVSNNIDGFTRIVVPDTFLYKNIIQEDNLIFSLLNSGVKNTIGPSLIWYVSSKSFYIVSLVNIFFIILILFYLFKLSKQYSIQVSKMQKTLIVIFLLPSVFYFSVGSLKELPTTLLIIMFIYYLNKKNIFILFSILLLMLPFRYQLDIIFLLVILLQLFKHKQYYYGLFILLVLCFLFPFLHSSSLVSSSTTELFRKESNISGLGAYIEHMRNMPILSVLAIPIRVFQSLFAPILSVKNTLFENGDLSIYELQQFLTLIILLPYLKKFFSRVVLIYKYNKLIALEIQSLYILIIFFMVFSGGFSFIHHRYLFPAFSLIMLSSIIPISSFWRVK